MIPKLIHFIWWQGINKIPNNFKKNINSWRKHNKNYKIILWDKKTIMNLSFVTDDMNKYKYMIQKIDYCKYLLLYYYGGVYIDIDIFCNDNLDNHLIQDKINVAYIPIIKYYKLINNGFIALNKNNKTMLNIINRCKLEQNTDYFIKEFTVLKTTGPYMFNNIIRDDNNLNIFDQNIILETDLINNNTGKLCVHRHSFSWINNNLIYLINTLMYIDRNFYKLLIIILFILFVI